MIRLGILLLSLVASITWATHRVQVVGLFPKAAVVNVDGQRKLVWEGQKGPQGVRVVKVDDKGATLEVDGQQRRYDLSREDKAIHSSAAGRVHNTLMRSNDGHYRANGAVNDRGIRFLVDTGASSVVLAESTAKRLNLSYEHGERTSINTASGMANGWAITASRISVGPITLHSVDLVVLEGSASFEPLLGMSFLNRVNWREDQGLLQLESRL